MIRTRIDTGLIKVGDQFITPADGYPYRVLSIKEFTHHPIRGWERVAGCVWLDTGVIFTKHFGHKGFWTLREEYDNTNEKIINS